MPSEKIDPASISHLSRDQQLELLEVLDRYPECFSDVPGCTDVVTHNLRIRNEYFYDYLRENWKLRKRVLFYVQIENKICMFDVMIYLVVVMVCNVLLCVVDILKWLLCRANAHLGENSSSMILALQEFSLTFKYRAGRNNVAADCLSRLK